MKVVLDIERYDLKCISPERFNKFTIKYKRKRIGLRCRTVGPIENLREEWYLDTSVGKENLHDFDSFCIIDEAVDHIINAITAYNTVKTVWGIISE